MPRKDPLVYDKAMKLLAVITLLFFALAQPVAARNHKPRVVGDKSSESYRIGNRAYLSGDYATALRFFRPLAKEGHRKAQKTVGWMYATGRGLPRGYVMAFAWLSVAVENGDQTAGRNLYTIESRLSEAGLKEARKLAKGCIKNLKSCPE